MAALSVDGDSPTAAETRRVRVLLQTTLAQQEAYSYDRDRIHSTPRPSQSYIRHMDSPAVSSNAQHHDQPCGHDQTCDGAHNLVDQDRVRQEVEQAAHQPLPVYPTTSVEAGVTSRSTGVPCLVPALRNESLPKDFKGPHKVPNYTADLPLEAWIESYEMAMELLEAVTPHALSTSP